MIKIIYEDDTLLVLDKPAGLVVDKSETQQENTLQNWLEDRWGVGGRGLERAGIVHRLDKDTSGLILIAKTPDSLENLQLQFAQRETKKEYLALVHGSFTEDRVVEGSIGRNPRNRENFIVLEEGKEAVTEFKSVELRVMSEELRTEIFNDYNKIQMKKLERMSYGDFTLVRCFPKTGRTHQIRVHLKYIGFPIVADQKYAGRKIFRLDHRWCPRQFLHAAKLSFKHPTGGEVMSFESELPGDLKASLELLSKSKS